MLDQEVAYFEKRTQQQVNSCVPCEQRLPFSDVNLLQGYTLHGGRKEFPAIYLSTILSNSIFIQEHLSQWLGTTTCCIFNCTLPHLPPRSHNAFRYF